DTLEPVDTAPPDSGDTDDSGDSGDSGDTDDGVCPPQMVWVHEAFCIDRYEATLEEEEPDGSWVAASPYLTVGDRVVRASVGPGRVPQGYISGDQAEAACEAAGKRLCTTDEWLEACRGPSDWTFPYGPTHQPG